LTTEGELHRAALPGTGAPFIDAGDVYGNVESLSPEKKQRRRRREVAVTLAKDTFLRQQQ